MFKGFIGGTIAGAVGATIWALISWKTGYEIGWIAWGIGVLVGIGVASGGRSPVAGVTAVMLSVIAIAGGKYAAVSLILDDEFGGANMGEAMVAEYKAELETEGGLVVALADRIAWDREDAGETVAWKPGMSYEMAFEIYDYPQDIQIEAVERAEAMTPEERSAFIEEELAASQDFASYMADGGMDDFRFEGFLYQWGLMDILFVGLAVFSAYRIASQEPDAA